MMKEKTGAASTVLKVFMPKTLVNTVQCKCCFLITLNNFDKLHLYKLIQRLMCII